MLRQDIEFPSQGATLRGWFYPSNTPDVAAPGIVLQHGFTGVKEMYLDAYAEVFAEAGFACVVYDHPGFGDSDAIPGQPRQQVDPWLQVRGISDAITHLQRMEGVDPSRIGVWGSSYGGGNAIVAGATDKRIRAVAAQVPAIDGSISFSQTVRIDNWAATEELFAFDRLQQANGEPPMVIPVVDADPLAPSGLPTPDSYQWFTTTAAERAPGWRNELTLRSLEMFRGYAPGDFVRLLTPTPLLLVVAEKDRLADTTLALQAYERATEPKRLRMIPGGHFDAYTGDNFQMSAEEAVQWFRQHLSSATPVSSC
ncbi:alpha/beta hydrolase [Okibacterium endophyticum]